MKLKMLVVITIIAGVIILGGCSQKYDGNAASKTQAVMFKSQGCGCCQVYPQHLEDENFNVDVKNVADISSVKKQYSIPQQLQSCHTTIIDNYFVEGHMPAEAIKKLLAEKPDIAGIALPGMPSGAPGMPGKKEEPWIIYGVKKDGSYGEFMRI